MKILLACVGKLREKHFALAAAEYLSRIQHYIPVEIAEIPALSESAGASDADRERIKKQESERLIERVPERSFVVAMDIRGRQLSSEAFAEFIEQRKMYGKDIAFLIGGSLGLSPDILRMSDMRLSMSDMTFPHQLARIMLLEQLYRGMKISAGEVYHK